MTDKYTKVILTVIAVSLAWIGINVGSPISDAYALMTQPIEITGVNVSRHTPLPVYVTGELKCKQ
jgi:hypothetical protein